MDCLIGVVKKPEDGEMRKEGILLALSLDCGISSHGNTKEEAAEKLADLLKFHLEESNKRGIMPYVHNEELLEELMQYSADLGMPEAVPDIDLVSGLRLRCYDISDYMS